MRSMSISCGPCRTTGSGTSGMRALRPLPREVRRSLFGFSSGGLTREHFFRERNVRRRTPRLGVINDCRQAMAGCLAKTDVAGNDRIEHFLLEELAHIAR